MIFERKDGLLMASTPLIRPQRNDAFLRRGFVFASLIVLREAGGCWYALQHATRSGALLVGLLDTQAKGTERWFPPGTFFCWFNRRAGCLSIELAAGAFGFLAAECKEGKLSFERKENCMLCTCGGPAMFFSTFSMQEIRLSGAGFGSNMCFFTAVRGSALTCLWTPLVPTAECQCGRWEYSLGSVSTRRWKLLDSPTGMEQSIVFQTEKGQILLGTIALSASTSERNNHN
jgi:hypothetical protein